MKELKTMYDIMIYLLLCISVICKFNVIFYGFDFSEEMKTSTMTAFEILERYINTSYFINVGILQGDLDSSFSYAQGAPSYNCNSYYNNYSVIIPPSLFILSNDGIGCIGGTSNFHMTIKINRNPPKPFYFNSDKNVPYGFIDFISVILHESMHGLGFYSGFTQSDGYYIYSPNILIYDLFIFSEILHFPLNKYPLKDVSVLIKGPLFFKTKDDPSVSSQVYTPSTFNPGSSISHTFQTTLMYYKISSGYASHCLSNDCIIFLKNVGYPVGNNMPPCFDVISSSEKVGHFLLY